MAKQGWHAAESRNVPEASGFWNQTKYAFERETDLANFKNWPVVRSVPIYNDREYVHEYAAEVVQMLSLIDKNQRHLWCSVLKEPYIGHTEASYLHARCTFAEGVETTAWVLKSAHHILTFEQETGKSILDYDQIVDFGAGIGETARVIRDLGFKGDYIIYDLPEVARVSSFYLDGWARVATHYNQIPRDKKTLFIGTWSLSEVPYSYRDEIASYFVGSDFLIIFQNRVFDYNNSSYFLERFPHLSRTFFRLKNIAWHSGGAGNYYMIAIGGPSRNET